MLTCESDEDLKQYNLRTCMYMQLVTVCQASSPMLKESVIVNCCVNMSIIMKPSLFNYPPCGWTVESVTFVGSQHSQVVENNIVVYESHMRTYTCTQNAVGFLLL